MNRVIIWVDLLIGFAAMLILFGNSYVVATAPETSWPKLLFISTQTSAGIMIVSTLTHAWFVYKQALAPKDLAYQKESVELLHEISSRIGDLHVWLAENRD